jgi:hypothetical protein
MRRSLAARAETVEGPDDQIGLDDAPYQLIQGPWPFAVGSNCLFADVAGLRINGGKGIADLFHDPTARVGGQEEINGAATIRVSIGHSSSAPEFSAWVDPKHDYVPVRWTALSTPRANGKWDSPKPIVQVDVVELGRFSDASDGSEHWFPIRAKVLNAAGERYDVEITDLQINTPIDPARLEIRAQDLPDGVRLPDGSCTGGRADLARERQQYASLASKNASPLETIDGPPVATADNGSASGQKGGNGAGVASGIRNWSLFIEGACAAIFIAVFVILVRQRRNREK